jgi:hypothetical protein
MSVTLNEMELEVYSIVEAKVEKYINDFLETTMYDLLYDQVAEYPFESELDIPPGSRSVDAAVDRIHYHLKNKFKQ